MPRPEEIRARREKLKAARDKAIEEKIAALDRAQQIHEDAITEYNAAMRDADARERALQDECPHAGRAAGQSVCQDCGQGGRR